MGTLSLLLAIPYVPFIRDDVAQQPTQSPLHVVENNSPDFSQSTFTFRNQYARMKHALKKKAVIICTLAALFYCFDYFVQVTPSVISHGIMARFHLTATGLGLLGSSFFLPYCLMQLPAGLLLQRFGSRVCLSSAAFISAFALVLFATTHSWFMALTSRTLLGFCAAFSFISAIHLISQWFQHRYFAPLAGAVQLSATLGSIMGLAPIASAVTYWHWQSVIMAMGAFSLLLAILYALFIRDDVAQQPAQAALHVRECFIHLNNHRQECTVFMIGFISWMPISSIGALWGVPYLVNARHISTTTACHFCSALWVGLGSGSLLVGWLSEKIHSRRTPTIMCFLLCCIGSFLLIHAPHLPAPELVLSLYAIGFSAGNQALSFSYIKDRAPARLFPSLSGLNNMSAILGGASTQLITGCLLSWQNPPVLSHPIYTDSQYQFAFLLIPIFSLAGLIMTLMCVKESHPARVAVSP